MKLGLFNMPLHPPGRLHADTYDEDLDLMSFADELGYAEAWIGEHFTTEWENMPAPDLFIARALGVTKNLVMGTGVSLLAFHDPVMIAHRMAMLDHLARGRSSSESVREGFPPTQKCSAWTACRGNSATECARLPS